MLVHSGAGVDSLDGDKCSPMTIAAQRGFTKIVKFLVKAGGSVSRRDSQYHTPLARAAMLGSLPV